MRNTRGDPYGGLVAIDVERRGISIGKLDLSQFFGRVYHDIPMGLVSKKLRDPRVLLPIRRYLEAGMMDGGLIQPRLEGPPLSPLQPNILITELDGQLEKPGHS